MSCLIVTHNKPELAAQLVLSIAMASDTPDKTEVLIYQSGPSIQDVEALTWNALGDAGICGKINRIAVIRDIHNLGVSIGLNTLSQMAQGEFLLMCNDDMIANASGWYAPLKERLLDTTGGKVGMVCSQLINGGTPFKLAPTAAEMQEQIKSFSDAHKGEPAQPIQFIESESNQPWLFRKNDLWHYEQQDPIINQRRLLCEWSDPSGCGWAQDWCTYHKIKLAGHRLGMVPQSLFFHYDHVTVRERDKAEPGWTNIAMERYAQKWGTYDKQLKPDFTPRKFYLFCGALTPYVN